MGKIIFKSNSRSVLSRTNNNTVIISYPVANSAAVYTDILVNIINTEG
jgi:hypothetical protein